MEYINFGDLYDSSVSRVFAVLYLAESPGVSNTCLTDAVFVVYLIPPRGLGKEFSVSLLNNGMPSLLLFLLIIKNDIVVKYASSIIAVKSSRTSSIHNSMKCG